jgi:tetratricopeptide (TPR) repeat protein
MRSLRIVAATAALCALVIWAAEISQKDNQVWEYRNLGKAFYENPDTHLQAVDALRSALQLDPNSVRDRINYGLALLRAGQTDAGVAELIRAQKQDPSIPHTWFNLGITYKRAGEYDKAIDQLRGMLRLVPDEQITHYNLGAVLRAKNDINAALAEFLEAEKLNPDLAGPHFHVALSKSFLYAQMSRHCSLYILPRQLMWGWAQASGPVPLKRLMVAWLD